MRRRVDGKAVGVIHFGHPERLPRLSRCEQLGGLAYGQLIALREAEERAAIGFTHERRGQYITVGSKREVCFFADIALFAAELWVVGGLS